MGWGAIVKLLAVLAVVSTIFAAGHEWRDRSADLELERLKATHAAAEATWESDMMDAAIEAADISIQLDKARQAEAKVVTREVIRYVQDPDIPRTVLPDQWVQLNDRAWRNASTSAPAEPFTDGSRPITDADALAVTTYNAEICGQAISNLRDIRAFYREVRGAANGG